MTNETVALIDALAWATIQVGAGYLVYRMPASRFEHDGRLWRRRSFETRRRYERLTRVRRWKSVLPEGGAVFPGGVSKRTLLGRDADALRRYALETRRGELGHWLAVSATPLFALWNPAWLMPFMVLYAAVTNAPCIIAMRYNRLRIEAILARPTTGITSS